MTNPTNKDMRVAGPGSVPEAESEPEFTSESAYDSPRESAPESAPEFAGESARESEVATSFPPAHPDGPRTDATEPSEAAAVPETAEAPETAEPAGAAEVPQPGPAPFEQLIEGAEADRLRTLWSEVQAGFIDDPEGTVRQADELAAEIVNALGRALAERKRSLDEHGRDGTEELRLTMRGYREFVDRMLAA